MLRAICQLNVYEPGNFLFTLDFFGVCFDCKNYKVVVSSCLVLVIEGKALKYIKLI